MSQDIILTGQVGPIISADGTNNPVRQSRTNALVATDAHGRYYEAASRGRLFSAAMQAGASLGTALTATAVTLTLYNPLNSGVYVALLEVAVGITTMLALPGAASSATSDLVLAGNVSPIAAIPATNTLAAIRNCLLGGPAGVAAAYTATTLPAAPVVLRNIGSLSIQESTAASITQCQTSFVDPTDAKIVLAPNTAVTLQAIGAAISGIVSMLWEEIPILPS